MTKSTMLRRCLAGGGHSSGSLAGSAERAIEQHLRVEDRRQRLRLALPHRLVGVRAGYPESQWPAGRVSFRAGVEDSPGNLAEVATSGTWSGQSIGFLGQGEPRGSHAKLGVSTGSPMYAIFGDMNQDGALSGNCQSSQNARGGTFYVVNNAQLFVSMTSLLKGSSAPLQGASAPK